MSTEKLWLHGLAAAAAGGALTALTGLLSPPAASQQGSTRSPNYATTIAGGALLAVLAYFMKSPLQPGAPANPPQPGN